MGTNYYAIPKDLDIDDRIYAIYDTYLKEGEIDQAILELQELQKLAEGVHIGKSSIGWKFAFNSNDKKYYELTRESIDKFIRSSVFKDEYRRLVDPDEFWKLVDAKADGIDDTEYSREQPSAYFRSDPHDYYEGGLRFIMSTDFS